MMYYNYGMGPWFGFGWIFMIIFWVLVIWAIIALIRGSRGFGRYNRHHCPHCREEDIKGYDGQHHINHHLRHRHALDLLEERYVKGEISKEEYHEKKKDLMS